MAAKKGARPIVKGDLFLPVAPRSTDDEVLPAGSFMERLRDADSRRARGGGSDASLPRVPHRKSR